MKSLDSTEYVNPGIGIHDFKFWNTPPTVQELICFGGNHAGLVIRGERVNPIDLLFSSEIFHVYIDGFRVASDPASEIMDDSLHSLRWLVKFLSEKGLSLKKHSLVIS